jgi:hypothetical protein
MVGFFSISSSDSGSDLECASKPKVEGVEIEGVGRI